jgi:FkbM family methyltransferase
MPSEIPTATFSTLRLARADYGPQLELLVALLAARLVHPGQTAVDGGSNTGLHALALARLVGPTGHVLCVEPVPEVAVKLVRHLADADLLSRCSIHPQALWNEAGLVDLVVDHANTALSHLRRANEPVGETRTVPACPLDDLVGTRSVSFIKLDLEGADIQGIEGGRSVLHRCRPPVVFECGRPRADGRRQGRTCEEFLGFFADLDYRVFDLHGRSLDAASWADEDMSFELLAWPAEDDRLPMVLATMRWFWETAADRPPATWHDCWVHCRDPLAYLRGIGAVPLGSDGLPAG